MNEHMPLTMTWVLAFAGILLAIQWIDFIRQWLGAKSARNLRDVNLASREDAQAFADGAARGGAVLDERVRGLLTAWSQGWSVRDLLGLAEQQRDRHFSRARAMATFVLTLMVGAILALLAMRKDTELNTQILVAAAGIAGAGATYFIRATLLGWIDRTIERDLLGRLPGAVPGTGMTAQDLAGALGGSIEAAFKNYLPQPDGMASAVSSSLEGTRKAIESAGGQMGSELKAAADKWQATLSAHAQQIEKAAGDLSAGMRAGTEPAMKILQESLGAHAVRIQQASAEWTKQLQATLEGHASRLDAATRQLAQQLEQVVALGQQIENVLHVQQSVEGAMKSVSASAEFQATLAALRSHLEESDKVLREVTRPRTIRLVETEMDGRGG